MKITFADEVGVLKINFLQSLVLLYLPCESFGNDDDGSKQMTVRLTYRAPMLEVRMSLDVGGRSGVREKRTALSHAPDKTDCKDIIGRAFVELAEELFGYRSPWGMLTGIRPAKKALLYRKKCSFEETVKILTEEYFVAEDKAKLAVTVCENEKKALEKLTEKSCSLYVSIPFCPSKCLYCSFVSSATKELLAKIPPYLEALLEEIRNVGKTVKDLGLTCKTVYVGGGTPGILTAAQIAELFDTLWQAFPYENVAECTFEAGRPECVTKEKLTVLKKNGVRRISINTQTTNDDILRAVGRTHTYADYVKAVSTAREVGFDVINTDLIAGLPGEEAPSFEKSAEDVLSLGVENFTVHAFTLKKSSVFKTERLNDIHFHADEASRMIAFAQKTAEAQGYKPYYLYRQKNTVGNLENTGYCINDTVCYYNVYMMGEYHTVFSCGAGAVTKYVSRDTTTIKRYFAPKYPYEYLDGAHKRFDERAAFDFYSTLY